ncbi:hypothetical protein Tco_0885832 [Tanacetum coccineum]
MDQFPTTGEMAWVESISDDQQTVKIEVCLHCYMMSHGLKVIEGEGCNLDYLELQVSTLKKQVSGLNDKLSSSDASFTKSKAKGNKRKKKIKSLTKKAEKDEEILRLKATPPEFASFFQGQFQGLVRKFLASDEFSRVQGELLSLAVSVGFERRLVEAPPVAQIDYAFLNKISKHATKPISIILQLEPKKLARLANFPTSRDARVSPLIAKESTVTPASISLELSANVAPASSIVCFRAKLDVGNAVVLMAPDAEVNDGVAHSKSGSVFVQGTSHVLDDATEVTVVGSERVSSGLTDVVVALSAGEKGDGSLPSFAVDEEAAANPAEV